jgi:hypothetical protein
MRQIQYVLVFPTLYDPESSANQDFTLGPLNFTISSTNSTWHRFCMFRKENYQGRLFTGKIYVSKQLR